MDESRLASRFRRVTLDQEARQAVDEYPELYRLWRKHAAVRLGVRPVGMKQQTKGER